MNTHAKQSLHSRVRRSLATLLVLALCAWTAVPAAAASEGVVNINEADVAALQMLPRVGPAVAGRIVEHRESHGKFREKADLLLVRGIGDATFELIEPYVTLEGPSTLSQKVRTSRPTSDSDDDSEASRADHLESRG